MKNTPQIELRKIQTDFPVKEITGSKSAANFIRQFYADDMDLFESCFILLLNRSAKTIGFAKISQGGIAGTVVDVRIIAKYCIESLCSSVILAHNHPSGSLDASVQDMQITDKLKKTLEIFDVKLFDHIILTSNGYYSFADNDKM